MSHLCVLCGARAYIYIYMGGWAVDCGGRRWLLPPGGWIENRCGDFGVPTDGLGHMHTWVHMTHPQPRSRFGPTGLYHLLVHIPALSLSNHDLPPRFITPTQTTTRTLTGEQRSRRRRRSPSSPTRSACTGRGTTSRSAPSCTTRCSPPSTSSSRVCVWAVVLGRGLEIVGGMSFYLFFRQGDETASNFWAGGPFSPASFFSPLGGLRVGGG